MLLSISSILCFVLTVIIGGIRCGCSEDYRTVCNNLRDVEHYSRSVTETWTELVIEGGEATEEMDDEFIKALRNVHSLTIVKQIKSIWLWTRNTWLDYLNLYNNNMETVNLAMFLYFKNLRTLILKNNKIKKFDQIYDGKSLRVLDLSQNQIHSFKSNLFADSEIKWMIVRHNHLEVVESKSLPSSLTVLNLDYNNLERLEEIVETLGNLEEFTASHNKITHIPDLSRLTHIKLLDLSYNNIKTVGDVFSKLTNLLYLDLSHCNIQRFYRMAIFETPHFFIRVNLAFNKLTNLDYHAISAFYGHKTLEKGQIPNNKISLYGNPINCRCLGQIEYQLWSAFVNKTKCDKKFFGEGLTPACIHIQTGCESNYDNIDDEDYKIFLDSVTARVKSVQCDLRSDFYRERDVQFVRNNPLY